jgi:glycosyltransferase involved in cell wall biosynthesis
MGFMTQRARIALLMQNLGGGLEKVVLNSLVGLVKNKDVALDLVVDCTEGLEINNIPAGVRIIDLKTPIDARFHSSLKLIFPLVRYLRQEKPDLLFSHLIFVNVVAAIAKMLAGVPLHLTLIEHNLLFQNSGKQDEPQSQLLPFLMRWLYPIADRVVAVSRGMADALETWLRMPQGTIQVIYNPVIDERLFENARVALDHPWFEADRPPVFLAAGRLVAAKDFPCLIQAFAQVRNQRAARLIVLGEGNRRAKLEKMVRELDLEADVALPGFVKNPYAYMSRARVFVLSSRWEGLPTVLIEAIACGSQIVSTDCPHGPREILAEGKYGRLVPVGDIAALAQAMLSALDDPIDAEVLKQRAQDFSIDRAVAQYLQLSELRSQNQQSSPRSGDIGDTQPQLWARDR